MPPYLPPIAWWRTRLAEMLDLPTTQCIIPRREMMRTVIAGADGATVRLSVPVVGGAGMLKHGDPKRWTVSDHGRWQAMHLGALDAAYSRTPYYQHYIPRIAKLINSAPGRPAEAFCADLVAAIDNFLGLPAILPSIAEMLRTSPSLAASLARDHSQKIPDTFNTDPETLSILHLLFQQGPATLFPLIL